MLGNRRSAGRRRNHRKERGRVVTGWCRKGWSTSIGVAGYCQTDKTIWSLTGHCDFVPVPFSQVLIRQAESLGTADRKGKARGGREVSRYRKCSGFDEH